MVFRHLRSSTTVIAATLVIYGGPLTLAANASPAAPASSPIAAPTAFAAAPPAGHRGVRQTADLYDQAGQPIRHVEGQNFGAAVVPIIKQLRSDRATLEQWRANAKRFAARSPRGMASVAMMIQIIDALSAPTPAEYHARLQKLPVKVATTPAGPNERGTVTTFSIDNVVRLRVFTEAVAVVADDAGPGGPAPEMTTAVETGIQDCPDGPCATDQERQDALAMAVALDSQAGGLESEMNGEWGAYVAACDGGTKACDDDALEGGTMLGGPSAVEREIRCGGEFYNFVGATASTHAAAFALIGAALAPPVGALVLTGLALGVIGGYAWMISAGMGLRSCMYV